MNMEQRSALVQRDLDIQKEKEREREERETKKQNVETKGGE